LIRRGIPLLIEKPVGRTAKEVRSLIRLAARHGVRIMPGHVERYNPVTLDVRETVRYRMYGRLKSYSFIRTSVRPVRVREDLVLDKLIHDIDLVHCTVGPFKVGRVDIRRQRGSIVECTVQTRHRNGVTGRIFSSWLVPVKKRNVEFQFERASLSGDLLEKTLRIHRHQEMSKEITGYRNNQIRDQVADFIYFLYSRNARIKPLVRMSDALKSAGVIDEIRRRGLA
jgi:predicted dehydrogenase